MTLSKSHTMRARNGFTLIELLVVMAIITILMSLTFALYGPGSRKAAEQQAKAQIGQLQLEIELFRSDRGALPASIGNQILDDEFFDWYESKYGTDRIYKTAETTTISGNRTPVDPWGMPYFYNRINDYVFVIGSRGPDGLWGDGNPNTVSNFGNGDDLSSQKGSNQ